MPIARISATVIPRLLDDKLMVRKRKKMVLIQERKEIEGRPRLLAMTARRLTESHWIEISFSIQPDMA